MLAQPAGPPPLILHGISWHTQGCHVWVVEVLLDKIMATHVCDHVQSGFISKFTDKILAPVILQLQREHLLPLLTVL